MTITFYRIVHFFHKLPRFALLILGLTAFLSIIWSTHAAVSVTDNFDDGQMDATKWKLGVLTRSSSQFDPQVQTAETGGRLTITPRVKASNRSYNGYVSVGSVNLTDARAEIEVVNIASSKAETIFALGSDSNNFLRFRAKGTTLYIELASNGSTTQTSISYNKTEQRFWRIRHLSATDQIVFETSANQTAWSVKKTVARSFAITNLFAEINAGTSTAIGTPGKAEFDNFVVATSDTTPTPSPTVSPTPAISPSPSPTVSPTPTPTPPPVTSNSRGYLTTPGELAQIKSKASQNIEPYKTAVSSLLSKAGTPTSWSYGTVDPTNRDLLQAASANLYAKALAYHLTGNDQYAAFVRQKVLEITSTITCSNDYSGGNGCILTLSRHIPAYVSAADLIADYPGWTAADKQAFQIWLRDKVYRFTDWASDERSTNWGAVGTAATLYISDYFAGSGMNLIDRNGTALTAHNAYVEARQRALDRNNGNSYMYNSVCSDTTGLGIQYYGGIPEETGRDTTGCWGTYLLTNDSSYSYMIAHLSGTLSSAELLLRRGDRALYDNIKADGGGSILRAILYVIENPYDPDPPNHSFDWLSSRKSILEIAYRYYRHPAIAKQLGIGTSNRNIDSDGNSAMPHFGTLTHGFAVGENPALPPVTAAP
jgi:hypothetical protein